MPGGGGSAFAALKHDGTVVSWGSSDMGEDSSLVEPELNNIKEIYSSSLGFAALKHDGAVVSWGVVAYMGVYFSSVQPELTNVSAIYSNNSAFVAIVDEL